MMEILYCSDALILCCKPVGLDSEKEVPAQLQKQVGGVFYPVHRLDQNVGGLMVYARTKEAAAELSRVIASGEMEKEYVALVNGTPPEQGDWTDLLFKDARRNKVFVVNRPRSGVKEARLEFKTLHAGKESLVRIRLHTGRSHQIRVQFASRGFPLVGDHKYGARDSSPAPMLYSCKLAFPFGGKVMSFEKLPDWAI